MFQINEEGYKKDFLTIPIEMIKCEIHIKKLAKLTTFEKLTLKFIYEENSLQELLNAFNAGTHIMNFIIAKLFYQGLIRLKLNEGIVELSDKIIDYVKNNKLDEYSEEEKSYKKRNFTFIQEKISGELFLENRVKEYLIKPHSPKDTNYYDVKANIYGSFPNLRDFSITKFAKRAIVELKSDIEDIEKIEFIKNLNLNKFYIPLVDKTNKKLLKLDYDFFPSHIQKAWQNAFESQHFKSGEEQINLELLKDETKFFSIKTIKEELFKALDSLKELFIRINVKQDKTELLFQSDIILDKISNLIEKTIELTKSINQIQFNYEKSNIFIENFKSFIIKAKKLVIISSTEINVSSIPILSSVINDLIKNKVHVILQWGLLENQRYPDLARKLEIFEKEIRKMIDNDFQKYLHIYHTTTRTNSNYILIDYDKLIYSNFSFLNWNKALDTIITFVEIEGGEMPLNFLEFSIDYSPPEFTQRSFLNKLLLEGNASLLKKLSSQRQKFILNLKEKFEKLKNLIESGSFNNEENEINNLKSIIGSGINFDSVSKIIDLEHEEILIDIMESTKNSIFLYTDELNILPFGPHFEENIEKFTNSEFSIILNKYFLKSENETKWAKGIKRIEYISNKFPQLKLIELEQNFKLNIVLVDNGLIFYSNSRILAPRRRIDYDFNTKNFGLIIDSASVNKEILKCLNTFHVLNSKK